MTVDHPGRRGFATAGTMLVAATSALFLVAGCHSSPKANAFAATPVDKAAEARLKPAETMPHLAPYDEMIYVAPPDDGAASAP